MAAVTAAAVVAASSAYGAYSSRESAKEANEPRENQTEQTTTQTPYFLEQFQGHIPYLMQEQQRLYQGAPTGQAPATHATSGGSGRPAPQAIAQPVSQSTQLNAPAGDPAPAAPGTRDYLQQIFQGAMGGGNPDLVSSGSDYVQNLLGSSGFQGRNEILADLQGRLGGASFDQPNDLLMDFLGAGGGGSGYSPFEGALGRQGTEPQGAGQTQPQYNTAPSTAPSAIGLPPATPTPVQAGSSSSFNPPPEVEASREALRQEVLRNQRRRQPKGLSGPGAEAARQAATASSMQGHTRPHRVRGQAGGPVRDAGYVGDATGHGTFGQQVRDLFDPSHLDPANDPTMQPYLDAFRREAMEGYTQSVNDLEATEEGAGRFGGSRANFLRTRAGEEFNEGMMAQIASTMMGAREAAQGRRMQGLGMVNQRDLSAMGDRTQRYGIDQQRAAARASLSASQASASQQADLAREQMSLQERLQMRGQDLGAIQSMMQHQQFGLNSLAGLGSQHSSEQMAALGAIPGLTGAGLQGLQTALGATSGMVNLDQIAAGERNSGRQAGAARAATQAQNSRLAFDRQRYQQGLPQQRLDDYLRTIGVIAGLGGTSHTQGVNVVPGAGINTTTAGWQGALQGAGAGLSLYNSFQGGGG